MIVAVAPHWRRKRHSMCNADRKQLTCAVAAKRTDLSPKAYFQKVHSPNAISMTETVAGEVYRCVTEKLTSREVLDTTEASTVSHSELDK